MTDRLRRHAVTSDRDEERRLLLQLALGLFVAEARADFQCLLAASSAAAISPLAFSPVAASLAGMAGPLHRTLR
jgi:hypothetical protein